jgi:uncharacterized tellurite resistance protein B-like protein
MTVRQILSARAARPQVEALLKGLVRAAVYLARADGQLGEAEVERLLSLIRERVLGSVGEGHLKQLASVPRVLDEARAARVELRTKGEQGYLEALAAQLPPAYGREALQVAWRVVDADDQRLASEVRAFHRLAEALGFSEDETAAIQAMDQATQAVAEEDGDVDEAIDHLAELTSRGWRDAFPELAAAGVETGWFDASVTWTSPVARLRLDLDARDHVLNVHVLEPNGPGPHVICIYGTGLHAVLAHVDREKDRLSPATVPELLSDLVGLCDALFLERDGRLVQVHPSR